MIKFERDQKECSVTHVAFERNKRIYQCDQCGELSQPLQNEIDLRNWVASHKCPEIFR